MALTNNQQAFIALVRAGLWEQEVRLSQYEKIDFNEVYRLAEEQSVIGLVAAGLEHVVDVKVPQIEFLTFVGRAVQIEQQNSAMNEFIGVLVDKMRKAGISTLLVKGQGIAQCYERPLWRSCGDVDLYLSKDNYEKAKALLFPIAQDIEKEEKKRLHLGMTIEGWVVELHGTMYTKLSKRMNRIADEVHGDLFYNGNVRNWNNNGVHVFLPSANNDVVIVFSHIINHFFLEGIGLRQICDWCRLLWRFRSELDLQKLESRIKRMGLMTEWRAFGAFAVDYLGMLPEAMPFYSSDKKWSRKGDRICDFVMEVGNFGHNRDVSYRVKESTVVVNIITLWRRICDFARFMLVFPVDSPMFFGSFFLNRISWEE